MSITKLKAVAGWVGPYAEPAVATQVRAAGTPLPTKAPRILIGLLTGDDPPPPTLVAAQRDAARREGQQAGARRDVPVDPRWRR